ncbi:MAG TPA: hypothetical protein VEH51_04380 [Burkholderiales bacterium]|nr:hypothetical protein [Burkholderiales bacterium]
MLHISAQQLAELLSGIARAQTALVHGIESGNPGMRSNFIVPAIQNAAHLRDHPQPTLTDLPVRILLTYMGRSGPDIEAIARDIERLVTQSSEAAGPGGRPESSVTLGEPAPSAGESLDFSNL